MTDGPRTDDLARAAGTRAGCQSSSRIATSIPVGSPTVPLAPRAAVAAGWTSSGGRPRSCRRPATTGTPKQPLAAPPAGAAPARTSTIGRSEAGGPGRSSIRRERRTCVDRRHRGEPRRRRGRRCPARTRDALNRGGTSTVPPAASCRERRGDQPMDVEQRHHAVADVVARPASYASITAPIVRRGCAAAAGQASAGSSSRSCAAAARRRQPTARAGRTAPHRSRARAPGPPRAPAARTPAAAQTGLAAAAVSPRKSMADGCRRSRYERNSASV